MRACCRGVSYPSQKTRWALASAHTELERERGGIEGWTDEGSERGEIRNGSEKREEEYF